MSALPTASFPFFDGYTVEAILGAGTYGTVHRARRHVDGRLVAIKQLQVCDPDALARFEREVQLLNGAAGHRYVVELLDEHLADDPPWFVMELCDGGSLRAWVATPRTAPAVVVALVHVSQGLGHLHDAGGFHRDIKPDNLLVVTVAHGGLVVKLGDLGLARHPDTGHMTAQPGGSPSYMAPEIHRGERFTQAADIYSLGATGIELLTGGLDPKRLDTNLDLPAPLRTLLQEMVDPLPDARPSLREVRERLGRILAGNLGGPPPPPPTGPARLGPPGLRPTVAAQPAAAAQPPPPPSRPAEAPWDPPPTPSAGGGGVVALLIGLGLLAAGAAATMNTRDANGRYRRPNGQYASGRFDW